MSNWRLFRPVVALALVLSSRADAARADAAPSPGPPAWGEAPPRIEGAGAACSFRHPACVHATGDLAASALAALGAIDRAWDLATGPLGFPAPVVDPSTGRYDVYLAPEPSRTALRERDPLSSFDRAAAFSVLDARLPPGRTLEIEATRELFAAIALGAAPATDAGSLRGETSYLAALSLGADLAAVADVDVAQAHPDRALVDTYPGDPDARRGSGSALFFGWLDESFAAAPGRVIQALWALAPTRTPASSPHFYGEPDGFDVIGASFKDLLGEGSDEGDVLEAFAIDRAKASPAPRLDWDIAWPSAPRALASPEGVAPTGAAYVRVATQGKKPGARLRVDLAWEQHARMRWNVVELDANGRELARLPIKAADKATEAHLQVVDLDAAAAVLVAGTNLGDASAPFDPDDAVWEPHGWLLTVAAE